MPDSRSTEILNDIKKAVLETLKEQGVDESIANNCAHHTAEKIRKEWGGMVIYITKSKGYELSLRDREIWQEFNGRNHRELCRKYDIALQWLYTIIKVQRKIELKERQGDVFGVTHEH